MHQYIIKCWSTKMSNTLYYAGWPGEDCVLWGPGADKAIPFVTRTDAVTVAQKLLDYGHIERYVIELIDNAEPVIPKLSYEEMLKLGDDIKIQEDNELLGIAIKELDKVIDYLYTETSEGQAFRDLLNVATKLKTLQFNMKEKK